MCHCRLPAPVHAEPEEVVGQGQLMPAADLHGVGGSVHEGQGQLLEAAGAAEAQTGADLG